MKHKLRHKIVSADRAIQVIKSGDRVVLEGSVSEPLPLIQALARQRERFHDVEIITASPIEGLELAHEKMAKHFRMKTFFARGGAGKIIHNGSADYIPISLWGIAKAMKEGTLPVDVAIIQVAPPDPSGNCSLGINVSYVKPAVEAAKIVIAELNDQMPRTVGDTAIPADKIEWLCESSRPLPEIQAQEYGQREIQIAKGVAQLIPSGATLELGIGAIPDAILKALHGKEDLGLHSGMISDSMMDLMVEGIITNANKPFDKGKSAVSMALGTRRLYNWVHENQSVSFHPSTYTHSASTISKIDGFVAVNSALEVDLTGQVNAEKIDDIIVSGIGGGLDFAQGALSSRGGFSIIALPSTADNGGTSRIVSGLKQGAPVTYHRGNVDFLVTEYGIADLRGQPLQERAERLISIAHPNFREKLGKEKKLL